MITIKIQLVKPLAEDLVYGLSKAPYGTHIFGAVKEGVCEMELSHEELEYIVQDCFIAGIYAGLNRMREPSNTPNQEI